MAIDVRTIFNQGGKGLIDLLDYCVRSVQMDPVFVFLAHEYRMFPSTPKAVALYDIFCAPRAPARLSVPEVIPPLDLRIAAAIRPLQIHWAQVQADSVARPAARPPLILPPKYLFDLIAAQVEKKAASMRKIKRRYKPHRTPVENLPGGKMTSAQRIFVDRVWEPNLRPRLVTAGFQRVATIA